MTEIEQLAETLQRWIADALPGAATTVVAPGAEWVDEGVSIRFLDFVAAHDLRNVGNRRDPLIDWIDVDVAAVVRYADPIRQASAMLELTFASQTALPERCAVHALSEDIMNRINVEPGSLLALRARISRQRPPVDVKLVEQPIFHVVDRSTTTGEGSD